MKKFLFIVFALSLTLCMFSFQKQNVSANIQDQKNISSSKIEYFEDGSYLTTELFESKTFVNTRSSAYEELYRVTVTQYSATDKVLWIYELTGTWMVETGVSAVATSSVITTTIEDRTWSFHDGESTYYGNVVHGGGNFKHKLLGITIKTVNIDLNMVCDEYGNITY